MQRPYYMDPRKAIEFGVADKVMILFRRIWNFYFISCRWLIASLDFVTIFSLKFLVLIVSFQIGLKDPDCDAYLDPLNFDFETYDVFIYVY